MKVYWSALAEADLDDIYEYIALDSLYYANQFIDRLLEATDKLENYPRIGRRVPEAKYRDNIRELIVQNYRVLYLLNPEQVLVISVIHGKQNLVLASDQHSDND